jgi:Zn-dependent metalloprotease
MARILPFLALAAALFASFSFYAEKAPIVTDSSTPGKPLFYAPSGNPNWLKPYDGAKASAAQVLRAHLTELGLSPADELRLYRAQTDQWGMTHYRYQQYHRGVKVEHAEVLMHEREGVLQSLNGRWARGMDAAATPALRPEQAFAYALEHLPAERYMWENPFAERLLKRIQKDPKASFLPQAELVFIDPELRQDASDYRLAYSFLIHAQYPVELRKQLYIDAHDGRLLLELEMLCDQHDTPGIAETKYSGTRPIVTDSIAPNSFRLVETGRGGGIETYNLRRFTDVAQSVDFIDDDNYWNNFNSFQDEAATDAHWGAEMTFDYFAEKHGYIGVNGDSMPLIGFVHYGSNWSNAQWTGQWAQYGDGNGTTYTALTSLDVVGHEFVHGVTGSTANLIYLNESGALNESFSDIFGTTIEHYGAPEDANWDIGEAFHVGGGRFRNMADPNSEGHPDTYRGRNWFTGSGNNGGVHTNSGVQNKWFYLLTAGGEGVNDNDDFYSVAGLGMDTAALIAFHNLRYYLVRRSEYIDARLGSIQVAEEIYGICSEPAQQVARAWHAVGIGGPLEFDVNMLEILAPSPVECGFPTDGAITVRFRYNGCNTLFPGDKIPFAFQISGQPAQWDTLTLSETLHGGDTLFYTYAMPAAGLALPAVHQLRCWAGLPGDGSAFNDTLAMTVDNILEQNVDLGLDQIERPFSGCFMAQEQVYLQVGFYGCDSIAAGTPLELYYSLNGGAPVREEAALPFTLYRGDSFRYTFSSPVDIPVSNSNTLSAWVHYEPDFISMNDSIGGRLVANPPGFGNQVWIGFEGGEAIWDSMYLEKGALVNMSISPSAAFTGGFGLHITGGNLPQLVQGGGYTRPASGDPWGINEAIGAKICFCADLSGMSQAELSFDLKQTFSPYYLTSLGGNLPQGSSLRLLLNGQQTGENYLPSTFFNDPWRPRFVDLTDYAGSTVEICFETRTGIGTAYAPGGRADNIFLDNIIIGTPTVSTQQPSAPQPELLLFPNPTTGQLTILLPEDVEPQTWVELFDARGSMILRRLLDRSAAHLDLGGLPAGLYWARVRHQDGWLTARVVKQ